MVGMGDEQLISRRDIARITKCSSTVVQRWLCEHNVQPVGQRWNEKWGRSMNVYRPSEVLPFLRAKKSPGCFEPATPETLAKLDIALERFLAGETSPIRFNAKERSLAMRIRGKIPRTVVPGYEYMRSGASELTVFETSLRLGCKEDKVRRLMETGHFPSARICHRRAGKTFMISEEDIEAYEQRIGLA